ncbi:FixH family protein [Pedobacter sp. PWIIR3]
MNWGTKIMIGMGLFMTFIVVLGVLMVRSENDALVETNYYEKGLNYNQDYRFKEQAIKDKVLPKITISDGGLDIKFVTHSMGKIKLMRTSNKKLDISMDFNTDSSNILKINTENLAKGSWRVIINWKNEMGTSYLNEQKIAVR